MIYKYYDSSCNMKKFTIYKETSRNYDGLTKRYIYKG